MRAAPVTRWRWRWAGARCRPRGAWGRARCGSGSRSRSRTTGRCAPCTSPITNKHYVIYFTNKTFRWLKKTMFQILRFQMWARTTYRHNLARTIIMSFHICGLAHEKSPLNDVPTARWTVSDRQLIGLTVVPVWRLPGGVRAAPRWRCRRPACAAGRWWSRPWGWCSAAARPYGRARTAAPAECSVRSPSKGEELWLG